ncbi:protein FAR1-RELATED SEQUENCE 5-like [Beta vulgaris subsp. vulgaris]|uniref:protein FAR1-RELATED SEQUENCE 5-like n=1 Tax=Beta vulgaris subsp. vulgaris TaxID=3555 RepID=UPI002037059E|nr:protein FAR1-RELATED SEQUENCE 5-like [Beta vulgaris subsp. vulgaris]
MLSFSAESALVLSSFNTSTWVTPRARPFVTPGGTREWMPLCSNELTPVLGMKFDTLEEGIKFYDAYALHCGFNTRKSTTNKNKSGVVAIKYCLCNKAGFKEKRKTKNEDKPKEQEDGKATTRKRLVTRVGCKAQLVLKIREEGGYFVKNFYEGHTHPLYTPSCRKFQKQGRKMTILHKKFVVDNSKLNIGPTKSFRILKENVGGYDNIGASKQDFKNFSRDLKAYIDGSDAQMFVDNFKMKKLLWGAFFYDFEVDDEQCLTKAFWADPICRKNYALFGDMVSFDTTYETNRYNMVFGPFTGVDHHKRCITFGAGFTAKEDISSFEWLFTTFLKAMGNNEPTCLITDQDPAMKVAVRKVFEKTEHRFCMWHIMEKVSLKMDRDLLKETDFHEKLRLCVWDLGLEPLEFEEKWNKLIGEFKLEHEWLTELYKIRKLWIPAYFRDLFLGGIMKTTSRSESENHFFTSFTNPHVTLVEFYMRFETAMDSQRHSQAEFDNDSKNKFPECKTPLLIEKHASEVFTCSIFYQVQEEVYNACFSCGIEEFRRENDLEIAKINEVNRKRTFEVVFNNTNYETNCSCKMFQRHGLPCRHMVWVWKAKNLTMIPDKYVLNRWTKMATKKPIFDLEGNILDQCTRLVDKKKTLNELWSEIYSFVSVAEQNEEDLAELVKNLRDLRLDMEAKKSANNTRSKTQDIELLIGSVAPSEITIKPPKISSNKGSGTRSGKRIKGEREKAIEQHQKKKRLCSACGELGYHDLRNCPSKISS